MMTITFRTPENKIYKLDIDQKSTIAAAKEKVAKEINCDRPQEIKFIHKAKLLIDDMVIESLNMKEHDFILVHAPVNKTQKINESDDLRSDLPDVAPLPNSSIYPQLTEIPKVGSNEEPTADANIQITEHQVSNSILIMRQAITISHQSLANFVEAIDDPQVRQNPEILIEALSLDPADYDCQGIKDGTLQPLDFVTFGMLLAQSCIELNIDPMEMMNIGAGLSSNEIFNTDTGASSEPMPQPEEISQEEAGEIFSQFSPKEQKDIKDLQELGFPLNVCIKCYKACDGNEERAADLLFQM